MRFALFLCFVVVFIACDTSSTSPGIPAFVEVSQVQFSTTVDQGSNSHAISELWFYVNGNISGVLDTPARLPVLESGNHNVTVFAGIKNNGMGTSRIRYPFYTAYDTVLNLQSGQSVAIDPKFTYLQNAIVNASRNFEAGNTFTEATGNSGTIELLNEPELASSGVRCVRMKLPADAGLCSYVDESNIELSSGDVAFMEVDYSCNNTFIIGMYVVTAGQSVKVPVLYLTPTNNGDGSIPTWNKVYMDLGMVAVQYPFADYYRFYVECVRNESLIPTIYLDDIKIVR